MFPLRLPAILASAIFTVGLLLPPFSLAQSGNETDGDSLSLQTANAEKGFALAIELARKAVTETQPHTGVLHGLRPEYSHNPDSLIAVSHVVAVHFQTVAAANDYWREESLRHRRLFL